jgi:DNA-binding NarL/FixJ family response regulator
MKAVIIGKNKAINDALGELLRDNIACGTYFIFPQNILTNADYEQLKAADLLLIDLNSSFINSQLFVKELHGINPNAKIIALHIYKDLNLIESIISAGASAYLLVNTNHNELITAVAEITAGKTFITSELDYSNN